MPRTKKPVMYPFPALVEPMLATLVKEPFNDPDWVFEVKLDGYRVIGYVQAGKATLRSRNGQDYTKKYPVIARELQGLPDCVVDGEIVVLDTEGKSDFSALQNYSGRGTIAYFIFDLLYLEGVNYMSEPLLKRKEMLSHVITSEGLLHYNDHLTTDGIELFKGVNKLHLEGIVAKRKDSVYQPGRRSADWLKIKLNSRREYVVGGWAESKTTSSFRSILFGEYVNGVLKYVHHSGGGYTAKEKSELFRKFKELEIKKPPFGNPKDIELDTKLHWIKPELVAEFELSNKITKTGKIRHPAIFKGLRDDKNAPNVEAEVQAASPEPDKAHPNPVGSWEAVFKHPIRTKESLEIKGRKLEITNIERHVWYDVTKADLIQYYISVSDYILPRLKDRPLGLNISLYNPEESFFLRGMEGNAPKWATIFKTDRKHKQAGKSDKIEWLVCNDLATLIWIVNLECIDIHPWVSRTVSPNEPDYIAIDLDPSDNDFNKVIDTALAAKQLFDKLKLKSFVKTSGKTGMHLFIPCTGIEYGRSRAIAENICTRIHQLVPSITTMSTSVNSRGNKLYVDPSQNDYADRLAAAYCARAYHIPSVSTPLEWKEIKPGLNPAAFTIKTIGKRLDKKGDLWSNLLNRRIASLNSKVLVSL